MYFSKRFWTNTLQSVFLSSCALLSSCAFLAKNESGTAANAPHIDPSTNGKTGHHNCQELPLTVAWHPPKSSVDKDQILRPVTGYKLYLKPAEDPYFSQYINVGNVTKYEVNYLKKGTTYQLKVTAYNDNGEGGASPPVSRTICE